FGHSGRGEPLGPSRRNNEVEFGGVDLEIGEEPLPPCSNLPEGRMRFQSLSPYHPGCPSIAPNEGAPHRSFDLHQYRESILWRCRERWEGLQWRRDPRCPYTPPFVWEMPCETQKESSDRWAPWVCR